MKTRLLKKLYELFPFPLEGDAIFNAESGIALSCIVPTYQRDKDLKVLLNCLAEQNLDVKEFEVIVAEDGASVNTGQLVQKFKQKLNLIHLSNPVPLRNVAKLRNQGLVRSTGSLILYLDDDTIRPQEDFLRKLVQLFADVITANAVQIRGEASYGLWKIKYDYLDSYSFATRCVAYRRSVLAKIGGFSEKLISYEDIELAIRFTVSNGQIARTKDLFYRHPPLYFDGWKKPLCNGLSFLGLFGRYSKPVWFVCYFNALRFLPYILLPGVKGRQWGKISAGFLLAPFFLIFQKMTGSKDSIFYR